MSDITSDTEIHSSISIHKIGFYIALYGVAITLLWIGVFKFHPDEAHAIRGIISSSPLISWLYGFLDIHQASILIGSVEIVAGILLALYPISSKASLAGGIIASIIFLTTITFLLSAPGVLHTSSSGNTLPFPSLFGGFLFKDIVLLGAALCVVADSAIQIIEKNSADFEFHL
ncbi:DUF417 family protein [Halomonas binhaiensis]|uniref:DUF417 family protein n=1 Tax=Halomonas binhaiensis TaxID=2562282 RepID=A0A5C1NEB3_9GAMM|nr:DUF417 family protein [Halomonas binhaiensis]QEM81210.1 DUF417 family protein [Halomonas binhaiensis]